MIPFILVLAALAKSAAAETFSGVAKYHTEWSAVSCGDGSAKDGTKNLMALNEENFGAGFFGNSSACGNTITVNWQDKSVVATVVSVGMMGLNNFDLSKPAYEQLSPIDADDPGQLDVTWSWDNGFNVATGVQDTANLAAMSPGGVGATANTATAASSSAVPAVSSAVSAIPAVSSVATSVAAVSPAPVAPVVSSAASVAPVVSAAPVAPVVSASTPVAVSPAATTARIRPTGNRGGRGRRCAA